MNAQPTNPDIFLIDADPKLGEVLKVLFVSSGRNVIPLTSLSNVSTVFSLHPKEARIVVIDVQAPKFSGLVQLQKIVNVNPYVKIIIAYDHIDVDYVLPRLAPQVVTMIKKPYAFPEVINAINTIINEEK